MERLLLDGGSKSAFILISFLALAMLIHLSYGDTLCKLGKNAKRRLANVKIYKLYVLRM